MLLQATDSDSGVNARVMYHVTSSVGAPFSVNAATGQVFTTRQFGSGDPSRFDLTVYADNGRLGMVSNSARLAVTRSCHSHLSALHSGSSRRMGMGGRRMGVGGRDVWVWAVETQRYGWSTYGWAVETHGCETYEWVS